MLGVMKPHSPSEWIIGLTGLVVGWGVIALFVAWMFGYTIRVWLGNVLFVILIAPLMFATCAEFIRDGCLTIAEWLTPLIEWLDSKPGRKSA